MTIQTVHIVLPNDIDDPATPSGGNVYDRRICHGLAAAGWSVREHPVPGAWPRPDGPDRAGLARCLAALPDAAVVLVDGLIASAVPEVLARHADRLRLVILVHLPLALGGVAEGGGEARRREERALSGAAAVVTTSWWSRQRLIDLYGLPAHRVHAAPPGVDIAPVAPGSVAGSRLLCVAAVAPHKGHDVLLAALTEVADAPWSLTCVGSLERDPGFVEALRQQARAGGIADRVEFAGACTGPGLWAHYAAADLLVLASWGETYGMVVTEALARGIPVLATATNGLPEALGRAPDGGRPGVLVPPGEPAALAGALRRWLAEPGLRAGLRRSAHARRTTLTGWPVTANLVARALSTVVGNVEVAR